jgi:RHS repeat-associated protein
VRQGFTLKERDDETGLDYFLARYYSSTQGRFTSGDPENAGADVRDPQSWNGYGYGRNNPLEYTDPDGQKYLVCDPDGNNCTIVSDEQFWAERRAFEKTGNTYTGSRDFFESGQIKNADGGVVATYVQISIDDQLRQQIFAIRGAVDPIPMATVQFFAISAVLGTGGGVLYYALAPVLAPTVTTLGLETAASGTAAPIVESAVSHATMRAFERQLEQAGRKSLEKSLQSFEKELAKHLSKIEEARKAGGYTSSMEKEVRIFQNSIAAIKQILARKP